MKRMKWQAIILVTALCLSLPSGCSREEASQHTSENTSAPASMTAVPEASAKEDTDRTAESTVSQVESSSDEPTVGPEFYYVAEETTEVSILYKFVNFFSNYWEDGSWDSSPWWDALEDATNVELELTLLSQDVFNEQMLLLAASGDLPDVVPEMDVVYSTGLSGAINDDVIYDLSPYLEEYAPNYYSYLQSYGEDTIRDVVLDDGSVGAMYALYNEPALLNDGLWIRDDWLEQVGMEVPTTLDELHDVLSAFKSELGAENAMYCMIGRNTVAIEMTGVSTAFGSPLGFYTYESNVHCSYIEDSYYEYLRYLKELAEESLFITSEVATKEQAELMSSNAIGVYGEKTANVADQLASIDAEGASFKAMAAPGEPSQCGPSDSMVASFYVSISTNCEHPELVLKMFDYLFTEPGSMLASYGIENVSYEYVDGTPVWTDLVTNNPSGAPYAGTSTYYLNPGFPALQIANINESTFTNAYQIEAPEIWARGFSGNAKQKLSVSLTAEENADISASVSDMNTYLTEQVYAWVFGGEVLDESAWNTYLEKMNTMRIQDILSIYQDAYDRYLNKIVTVKSSGGLRESVRREKISPL